jgi:hypothetical protein
LYVKKQGVEAGGELTNLQACQSFRRLVSPKTGILGMRAIVAEGFSGYENLKAADIPRPAVSDGRVLMLTGTDHKRG